MTDTAKYTTELNALRARIDQLEAQAASDSAERTEQSTTRRGMLRMAGAAAVGSLAAVVTSEPAAAANTDALRLGMVGVDNAATLPTGISVLTAGGADLAYGLACYESILGPLPAGVGRPAVFGYANDLAFSTGVAGFNEAPTGAGIIGLDSDVTGNGAGVRAESTTGGAGVFATSSSTGVFGQSSGTGEGVRGQSNLGVGVFAYGGGGALQLFGDTVTAPPNRVTAFAKNTMETDFAGNVWFCYEAGTPGKWRKLAGPASAGTFHAITPTRVYDSRAAAPSPGLLATGANRLVSVADGRDNNGTVTTANLVPAGATAVAGNITVTGTTGGFGYLAINPGGNTVEGASTINWFGAGQTIANGVTLTLNTTRQLTVICNGGGSTHFLIDIAGYYL
jgi:hypothetical protein